jgi:hypothetical protein
MVRETMFTAVLALCLALPAAAMAAAPQAPAKPDASKSDDDDDDDKPGAKPETGNADASKPDGSKPGAAKAEGAKQSDGAKKPDSATNGKNVKDDDDDDDDVDAGPAKLKLTWGGKIQTDLRFRPQAVGITPWYEGRGLAAGVDRNQNLFGVRMAGKYGRVNVKADIDFILYGYSRDVREFSDLTRREKIDPYRVDVQNLYVEIEDLFVRGLDLRVGQQIIDWGVGDQFNPTNNLNPDDVEDVLLFGKQQGNLMVKLDYWFTEDWSHQLVVVPIFRPAVLPRSGELGLSRVDRVPVLDDKLRWLLEAETFFALNNNFDTRNPTIVHSATPELPEASFKNIQVGYKIGGTVFDQDVSLSYYLGRHDFPVPYKNVTTQDLRTRCNPDDPSDCIQSTLNSDVFLTYPRMHVYGLNMAGEIPWLKKINDKIFHSIGYRLEAALIVPQKQTMEIHRGAVKIVNSQGATLFDIPGAEYDYDLDAKAGGPRPLVLDDRVFAKWVLGLDYTFNEHVYTNIQWVHGMPDEFGAGDFMREGWTVGASTVTSDAAQTLKCVQVMRDATTCAHEYLRPRIGDYLVWGFDFKALQQKLLIRLFTIFALNGVRESYFDPATNERATKQHSMFTKNGFSAVLYPEINYNFKNGLDLGAGVLAQIGKEWTKFGDPATGGTIVWTRARFAF